MLFESDIRIDVAILESQAYKKTIIEYSPESNAAKDYLELTKEILKKIKK
ncbi:MAG: ParA family protein [Solitalea-like symbiont of Acarus siro]